MAATAGLVGSKPCPEIFNVTPILTTLADNVMDGCTAIGVGDGLGDAGAAVTRSDVSAGQELFQQTRTT
jgi:hypothetical protein